MNILFVLYGGFNTNTANPLVLYARELHKLGHSCVIAVPTGLDAINQHENINFKPARYEDVVSAPDSMFPDGRRADVIHACTPRDIVRLFLTAYLSRYPTPLVFYLEDNESWISQNTLGLSDELLVQNIKEDITARLSKMLSHPFHVDYFVGLADAVAVIQEKMKVMVPPWVYCETIMIGLDIELFSPRLRDPELGKKYGITNGEKVIVYHGGMNKFTRPEIRNLCEAVGLINSRGVPCKLLRCGPNALDFLAEVSPLSAAATLDLGVLPKSELPDLLALADVLVQPGQCNEFEEYRLPGKVPEFLAMGIPVVLPDVNISYLFRDGVDAVILQSGTALEIADKCMDLFLKPQKAAEIGSAGRKIAEQYFDVRNQARLLEQLYIKASRYFDESVTRQVWSANDYNVPVSSLLVKKLKLLASQVNHNSQINPVKMLDSYADLIDTMERRVTGLETVIVQNRLNIKDLENTISKLHKAIAVLEDVILKHQEEINRLLTSTSWRITKPFRDMVNFIHRIIRR